MVLAHSPFGGFYILFKLPNQGNRKINLNPFAFDLNLTLAQSQNSLFRVITFHRTEPDSTYSHVKKGWRHQCPPMRSFSKPTFQPSPDREPHTASQRFLSSQTAPSAKGALQDMLTHNRHEARLSAEKEPR